jgi:hypothetical protein
MGGLAAALVLGGILGAVGERLSSDTGPMRATETGVLTQETLDAVPTAPLVVRAEALRLPADYLDTRTPEGPVFTLVESGQIEVTQEGRAKLYGPGDFFVERAGETTTLRAVETTTLSVILLLPAGSAES